MFCEPTFDWLFLDSAHEQSKFNAHVADINELLCPSLLEHYTKAILAIF